MKNSIIRKIISVCTVLILTAIFTLSIFVGFKIRDHYKSNITDKLMDNAFLIGRSLEPSITSQEKEKIQIETKEISQKLGVRVMVIGGNGSVISDSEEDSDLMGNHGMRQEIKSAKEKGYGESERFSDTLKMNMKL